MGWEEEEEESRLLPRGPGLPSARVSASRVKHKLILTAATRRKGSRDPPWLGPAAVAAPCALKTGRQLGKRSPLIIACHLILCE